MDRWEIVVREGGPAVVLTVRGVVRAGFGLLHDHLADAVDELGDRPAVVDVSELWVQHPAALQVLRSLLGRRPPGSGTVVLARTSTRHSGFVPALLGVLLGSLTAFLWTTGYGVLW